jgi:hypothetical protein
MKSIYLVDYWVPFPSSEYGGMISVIAKDDKECFDLLSEFPNFDESYDDRMMGNIVKAPKFALANDDEESRVVDAFLT